MLLPKRVIAARQMEYVSPTDIVSQEAVGVCVLFAEPAQTPAGRAQAARSFAD